MKTSILIKTNIITLWINNPHYCLANLRILVCIFTNLFAVGTLFRFAGWVRTIANLPIWIRIVANSRIVILFKLQLICNTDVK